MKGKAEAILLLSRNVDIGVVAELAERTTATIKALFTGLIVGVCSEDFQVGDEVDDSGEFFEVSAVAV